MELTTNLLKESNEFIRLPIIEGLITLKNFKQLQKYQDLLNNSLSLLSKDESWRVRYALGDKLHEVISYFILNCVV